MAADANFVDGRLRLAAFLRVVERDIPQRPSRFKQHAPLVREPTPELDAGDASLEGDDSTAIASQDDGSLRAPGDGAAEGLTYVGAEFDLSLSPTPTDGDSGRHAESANKSAIEHHKSPKATQQGKKLKQAARGTNVKGLSSISHKPSGSRKRGVLVHGLALLRTTTSDGGLPAPSDASKTFAMPITDFDPIDDSQLNCSYVTTALAFRPRHLDTRLPAGKKVLSNNGTSQSRSSHPVKKAGHPCSKLQASPTFIASNQHKQVGLQFYADGFEPNELTIFPTRRLRRREKLVRRQDKPSTIAAELALASGELPAPVVQATDDFVTVGDTTILELVRATSNLNGASLITNNISRAPDATALATGDRQAQHQQAERWEHTVRGQLSSITAPVRRDSGSSSSDASAERQLFTSDEEDDDIQGLHPNPHVRSKSLLRRRPALVQDQRYFEHAMYHLHDDESQESGDIEFWSQYSAME